MAKVFKTLIYLKLRMTGQRRKNEGEEIRLFLKVIFIIILLCPRVPQGLGLSLELHSGLLAGWQRF